MNNDIRNEHGSISWGELITNDVEGAKAFYSQLLGYTMQDMPMPVGTYTILNQGEQAFAGMMKIPQNLPEGTPPCWSLYITVKDIDAVAANVESLGGKVCMPITDIPEVGRFMVVQDPQGAFFCPIQYYKGF